VVLAVAGLRLFAEDWWVCSGDTCSSSGDNWALGCSQQAACVFTVADRDLIAIRAPAQLREAIAADVSWLATAYSNSK